MKYSETMKAVLQESYGLPEGMVLKEVPTPKPKHNEILVKVIATTVNDYDWSLIQGKPFIYRLMFGWSKPKNPIPGMELSGIVVDKGSSVKRFEIGDEVFGDISEYGFGTFAEYIAISEQAMILKPPGLSFINAAALPHAGLLAYQGLVWEGEITNQQSVLVNGAGGGVGMFAMHIIKSFDGTATGVDSQHKFASMGSLGYEDLVDYKTQDFTKLGKTYDLIIDAKSNRNPWAYLKALKPGGRYITVGGELPKLLLILIFGKILNIITGKQLKILALKANYGMDELLELLTDKNLQTQIDGPFPLSNAPHAISRFGNGEHKGKVVVTPAEENPS